MSRPKSNQSVDARILKRMRRKGPGAVATPADFLDLASRSAVGTSLSRLVDRGDLRRVSRGVYAYPRQSKLLGELAPSPQAVAKALARRGGERLLPIGAQAANLLDLSEQVPAKLVYLTDGPTRTVMIKNLPVELRQSTPKRLAVADRISGTVAEALRFLRKDHVDDTVIATLRRRLSEQDKKQLIKDIPLVPAWIGDVFRKIAEPGDRDGVG